MSHKFLLDVNFHALLFKIDRELARQEQANGCSYCGGKLHQADYPRSPLGLQPNLRTNYEERLSYCCCDCRRRTTPLSVRFFGRRRFPAPLLIFISALLVSITEDRLAQVKRHFGINVSESTWKRWQAWWQESWMKTRFWKRHRGDIPEEHRCGSFPRSLLFSFQGALEERIIQLLNFVSPITAGALRAV